MVAGQARRQCATAAAAPDGDEGRGQVLDKAGVWAFGSGTGGEFGMDPCSLGREGALTRPTHLSLARRVKEHWKEPEEEETSNEPNSADSGFKDFMKSFGKGGGGLKSDATAAVGGMEGSGTPPRRILEAMAGDSMSWFLLEEDDEEGGCGKAHTEIYGVGSGEYGAVGFVTDEPEMTPRRMRLPSDATPVHMTCGRFHAAVLFDDGSVRCVGSSQQGQLGSTDFTPDSGMKSCTTEFVTVAALPKVITVRSGWMHSTALSGDRSPLPLCGLPKRN